jgi:autotransporter translocation and assembly factor TamB
LSTGAQWRLARRVLLGLGLALLAVAWFGRDRWLEHLVRAALPSEPAIEFDSARFLSPGRVRIDGLRARDHEHDAWSASCDSVELQVELRPDWSFALAEVVVRGLEAQGRASDASDAGPGLPAPPGLPTDLPRARIQSKRIEWDFGEGRRLQVEGVDLRLDEDGLQVSAAKALAEAPGRRLEAPLLAEAAFEARRIEVRRFEWDERVRARRVVYDWSGSLPRGEVSADLLGGALQAVFVDEGARLALDLEARDLDASAISSWLASEPLAGSIDLLARARVPWTDPLGADLDGELDWSGAAVAGHAFDARADWSWRAGRLQLRRLRLVEGANVAWFDAVDLPMLGSEPCEWPATASLAGVVELHGLDLALVDERAGTRARARLPVHLQAGLATLDGARLDSEDGSMVASRLRLPAHRLGALLELDPEPLAVLEGLSKDEWSRLEARIDLDDLGDSLRFFGLARADTDEQYMGRASGAIVAKGGEPAPDLAVQLEVSGARILDEQIDLLSLDARLEGRERAALELAARTSLFDAQGRGSWDFESRVLDVDATVRVPDAAKIPFPLAVAGDARVVVQLDGPLDDLKGLVELRSGTLSIEGVRLDDAVLHAERVADDWVVKRGEARWQGASVAFAGEGRREADGGVVGRLESLSVARGALDWRLAAPAPFHLDAEGSLALQARLAGAQGRIDADLDLDLREDGGRVAARVDLARLASTGLWDAPPGLRDLQAAGRIDAQWSVDSLSIAYDGEARLAHDVLPSELYAAGRASWSNSALRVRLDQLSLGDVARGRLAADLPWAGAAPADGPAFLEFAVDVPEIARLAPADAADAVQGSFRLEGSFEGPASRMQGSARAMVSGWRWTPVEGEQLGPLDAELAIEARDEVVAVRATQAVLSGATRASLDGRISTALDLPRLWADPASLRERSIELLVEGELGDLSPLATKIAALRRLEGGVRASLRIDGTLGEPRTSGVVDIEGGGLRLAAQAPPISDLSARLRFEGRKVRLEAARGELGGAPFTLGGSLDWSTDPAVIEAELAGEDLLLARTRHATARADLRLRLSGTTDAPVLAGKATLVEGRWTKPLDPLAFALQPRAWRGDGDEGWFRLEEPMLARLAFAVDVDARQPFRVENEFLRLRLTPALRLSGTGELPVLSGELRLEPSRVYLPASTLQIEGGAIRFRPSRPDTGELDIAARAQALSHDVVITATGTLDDPLLELSSTPPAAREDLLLLLLTGRPPGGTAFGSGERAARGVALYVARDWLSGGPGDGDGDDILSRVELASGARTSRRGVDTIELSLRLGGEADSQAMYLVAERDVWEYWNWGLRFTWRPE